MTQQTYRANLSAIDFPLLARNQSRSIIMPGPDNTYVVGLAADGRQNKRLEIPVAYYMQNVFPTERGYKSIGFELLVDNSLPVVGPTVTVNNMLFYSLLPTGSFGTILVTNDFRVYFTTAGGIPVTWTPFIQFVGQAANVNQPTTFAYVNNLLYLFYRQFGCYNLVPETTTLTPVTLTGLNPLQILGIFASSGYMLAYSFGSVLWSSTLTPTDFTPSLITGAGGGAIQQIKGYIVYCAPIKNGFIIYSSGNIVSATYTGNATYPFQFRELTGSGGVEIKEHVGVDVAGNAHYAMTSKGLQKITLQGIENIYPEVSDYLFAKQQDTFDFASGSFVPNSSLTPPGIKVTVVANRFVVISYGPLTAPFTFGNQVYTDALVFDISLSRFGTIKFSHIYVYDAPQIAAGGISGETYDAANRCIALVDPNKNVWLVNSNEYFAGSNSTIVFGKFQSDRNHNIDLQSVELENIDSTTQLKVLTCADGKNISQVTTPFQDIQLGGLGKWLLRKTGLNHSIAVSGTFSLNSLLLSYFLHGRR